jgi:ABC-type uncharacterized transport system permease subunit
MPSNEVWAAIVAGLKGHQEALLAFALALLGAAIWIGAADAWVAAGLPVAIYVLYQFRMFTLDRHSERMAELGIRSLEKSKGIQARQKLARALEKKGA